MRTNFWRLPLQIFFTLLALIVFIWLLITFLPLIGSLLVAGLVAYILHPLVNFFTRHTRFSHAASANIVYVLFLLILAAIPAILIPVFITQYGTITPDFEGLSQQLRAFAETPRTLGTFTISLTSIVSDLETAITQTLADQASNLGNVVASASTNFLWVLVVLVSIYYFLREGTALIDWGLGLVSSERYRYHARHLVDEIDAIWGSFLRGQLLLMVIIGTLSWIGGLAVGLPGAFVVGLIAGVLDIIPSLGPLLAAIIAVLVALIEGSKFLPISNWLFAIIVLGIFLLIQQVENIWIRPLLMGRRLRLHPAIVFIGVIGSLALFGVLVTLIIIPLLSTLGLLIRYTSSLLRGDDPYPLPSSGEEETAVVEEASSTE